MSRGAAMSSLYGGSNSLPALSSSFATPEMQTTDYSTSASAIAGNVMEAGIQQSNSDAVDKQIDIQKQLADNDTDRTNTEMKVGEATTLNIAKDTELKGYQILNIKSAMKQIDAEITRINAMVENITANTKLTNAQEFHQHVENMFTHEEHKQQLRLLQSQINSLDANTRLTNRQTQELVESWGARMYGLSLDNTTKSWHLNFELPEILNGITINNEGMQFNYNAARESYKYGEGAINNSFVLRNVRNICGSFGSLFSGLTNVAIKVAK